MCRVQFEPSPQETTHIRTIRGGEAALDAFLLADTSRPHASPLGQHAPPDTTSTTRSPKMYAPSRTKRRSPTHPPHTPAQSRNPPFSPARPPAEYTRICSKLSRRNVTRIETPSPERGPMSHLSRHHPHGVGHDWSPQPQRGGYLNNLHLPTSLRMASRRKLPPEPWHGLFT